MNFFLLPPHRAADQHLETLPTKVSIEDVEAAIVKEDYEVLKDGRTTICTLTLYNGFTVRGESSCVAIENFDPVKANKVSRPRAMDEVWKHLGGVLAHMRYHAGLVPPPVKTN